MSSLMFCPFCEVIKDEKSNRVLDENNMAFVIRDGFPVTKGHTLIIPKHHVGSFFEITDDEKNALFSLLDKHKEILDAEFNPDSYNIGVNDGEAAGQTVPHLHIHLIPRYVGDMEDPKGGVRGVIPEKQKY